MRSLFLPTPWLLLGVIIWPGLVPVAAAERAAPYLASTAEPDEAAILPPPPAPGSPATAVERDVYGKTRALESSPRWGLATRDADRDPKQVLGDFSCALGMVLDAEKLPRLVGVMARLNADVEQATAAVKDRYKRRRPLVGNDAPLCVPRSAGLEASFSYPSGHATQGWASALVLAELAPDRASAILERGRAYGESRIVCGAHWPSDVEAARTAAAALVATLHGSPEFRADLEAARQDLAVARRAQTTAPEMAECRIEADAESTSPTAGSSP